MMNQLSLLLLSLLVAVVSVDAFSVVPSTATTKRAIFKKSTTLRNSRLCASVSPDSGDDDDLEPEFARVRRRRGGRYYDEEEERYDREAYDSDRGRSSRREVYEDDEDEVDDDYEEEDEEYGLLGDALIPNPLLDSIDPDGAAERFPEIARDPKFWFEMFLFIVFLDFLSAVGPQELPYTDYVSY